MNTMHIIIAEIAIIVLIAALWLIHTRTLRNAYDNLSVAIRISQVFKQDLPLRKIFPEIVQIITKTIGTVKASCVLIFDNKGGYKIQALAGIDESEFAQINIPRNVINEVRKNNVVTNHIIKKNLLKAATIYPLEVQGSIIGVFIMLQKSKKLRSFDNKFLQTVTNHIALEFEDRLLQTKLDAFSKGLSLVEYSYEKIVDNLVIGIVAVDPSGRILLWNKAMQEYLDVEPDKVIGKTYLDVMGKTKQLNRFVDELFHSNLLTTLNLYQHNKNQFSLSGYPLHDMQNNVIAYVIAHNNVTDFIKLQDQLRLTQERVNKELQTKVDGATKELREVNTELVRLNKLKSEFVSTISHELKTPLTSIKGYISLLKIGKLGPISEKQQQTLQIVDEQSDRLNSLIGDVLDLSKLESGKVNLNIETVDPNTIVQRACQEVRMLAEKKNLVLETHLEGKDKINADVLKFTQIVVNLLSNAIKFTPKKGKVSITTSQKKSIYSIEVSDTGVGITEEHLKEIFEPFYQVQEHLTRNASGTGLGLTIVKRLVALHKGEIAVKSTPGEGTSFTISLPVAHQ